MAKIFINLGAQRDSIDHETEQRMAGIALIVRWSEQMYRAGQMPPRVAKAFAEHFGGEEAEENVLGQKVDAA
jgi:hypothetical protein